MGKPFHDYQKYIPHCLVDILEGDGCGKSIPHFIAESVLRFLRQTILQQLRYVRGDSHVIGAEDPRIAVRKLDTLNLKHQLCEALTMMDVTHSVTHGIHVRREVVEQHQRI